VYAEKYHVSWKTGIGLDMAGCDLAKDAAEVGTADIADFIGCEALFQHLADDGIEESLRPCYGAS
jgi:hypothetical protein